MTNNKDTYLEAVWLKPEEYPEWDAFVESHPFGLVYHTSYWKHAIEEAFGHIRGHFLALCSKDNGKIAAGIPIYTVRSWLLGNRICSIPFASICDPLISSQEHIAKLLTNLENLRISTSSKNVEIRSLNATGLMKNRPFITSSNFYHHNLKLDRSLEELYSNFSRTGIRHGIERAQKNRIEVVNENSPEAVLRFYPILINSRKQLGLPLIPLKFFKSLAAYFPKSQFAIFQACLDQEVIAVLLMLKNHKTLHIEYTGHSGNANKLGAGKLLYWDAIQYAWQSGCSSVSFGRTDISNIGLRQFKKRWGTIEEPISVSFIKQKNPGINRLWELGKASKSTNWLFRHCPSIMNKLLGSFIYSHHG